MPCKTIPGGAIGSAARTLVAMDALRSDSSEQLRESLSGGGPRRSPRDPRPANPVAVGPVAPRSFGTTVLSTDYSRDQAPLPAGFGGLAVGARPLIDLMERSW